MSLFPTPLDLISGVSDAVLQPFQMQQVDSNLDPRYKPEDVEAVEAPLGVLENFKGTFEGSGFNLIFRPNNGQTPTTFPIAISPRPPAPPNDSVLQLSLSTENWMFGPPIGAIPNRGLGKQHDVFLNGVSYVQTVNDVTNVKTGKADGRSLLMHFEPGLWIHVPPTGDDHAHGESIVRMASIPHGTTINAQCLAPTNSIEGGPIIPPVNITPYLVGSTQVVGGKHFVAQDAARTNTPRLPQDLSKFIAAGTITQNILNDPNTVLRDANIGKNITKTISFTVSTEATTVEQGGGTTNIAFLRGATSKLTGNLAGGVTGILLTGTALASAAVGLGPNAEAIQMHATFWIETVQHEIVVPPCKPGQEPMQLQPPAPHYGARVPTFEVSPRTEITSAKTITVESTQIQYSQTVFLNFNGFTWPHVAVATLVPTDVQKVPESALD